MEIPIRLCGFAFHVLNRNAAAVAVDQGQDPLEENDAKFVSKDGPDHFFGNRIVTGLRTGNFGNDRPPLPIVHAVEHFIECLHRNTPSGLLSPKKLFVPAWDQGLNLEMRRASALPISGNTGAHPIGFGFL